MILTSGLNTVDSIHGEQLVEALKWGAMVSNEATGTSITIYNNRPNHFTIVANGTPEYILETTDYTAELTQHISKFHYEPLLVATADDNNRFEDRLAIEVIGIICQRVL